MEQSLTEWLNQLMVHKHWRPADLARAMNLSRSTISYWLHGERLPDVTNCQALADLADEPVEDVLAMRRRAEMEMEGPEAEDASVPPRVQPAIARPTEGKLIAFPRREQRVSAGLGSDHLDYEYIEDLAVGGRDLIQYDVDGQSMEPDVPDGSKVLVDRNLPVQNGKIVVARLQGVYLVKRYRVKNGRPLLVGNDGSEIDAGRARIEGVVFRVTRDV